ncbi:hypothetical protein FL867_11105 [Listeria monocytogenes]|nr:hypothetical protein [Listeria monocytogenes]
MIILLLLLIIEITQNRPYLFYLNNYLKRIILARMAFWNKPIRQNCLYKRGSCDVFATINVQTRIRWC